jgi:hypothetical protein
MWIFFASFLGSLGVELADLIRAYQRGALPAYCRKTGYWWVRILFALVAGLLPVVFGIKDTIHAFDIGVFAPILFHGIIARLRHT